MKKRIKTAFTLTEVLLAVVIVGVISTLVMPSIVRHYQEKGFDQAEERVKNTITSAIKGLAVTENKQNFAQTSMYLTEEPASYTDSSEAFIRNYLRAGKICGDNNGDCFAKTYYTYKDNDKKVYTPSYKGSCAKLRNGMSICITPQIGETAISVLVDLNGEKGPNVYGKDLREISLSSEEIASTDTTTGTVAWDHFLLETGCKLTCGDDYTLDEANCECKCSKTCDSDYTLDEDSCSCSCSKTCEDGYTLDTDTCSCVADSSSSDSDESDCSYYCTECVSKNTCCDDLLCLKDATGGNYVIYEVNTGKDYLHIASITNEVSKSDCKLIDNYYYDCWSPASNICTNDYSADLPTIEQLQIIYNYLYNYSTTNNNFGDANSDASRINYYSEYAKVFTDVLGSSFSLWSKDKGNNYPYYVRFTSSSASKNEAAMDTINYENHPFVCVY